MSKSVVVVMLIGLFAGCASLGDLIRVERPDVSVESVRVSSLTFEDAELIVDLRIENPNALGIDLTEVAYQFDVEGNQLISGTTPDGFQIAAFGSSSVSVPVAVRYDDIGQIVQAASERNELAYEFLTALSFELPVLGEITVPVRTEGTLPVVRLPRLSVAALRLGSIGITGATLELSLAVENPNGFPVNVDGLSYLFRVQNQTWLDGGLSRPVSLSENGRTTVDLEFSLNFASFGRALRDLLLGDDAIRYELSASLDVDPELPLLDRTTIPLEVAGSVPLLR